MVMAELQVETDLRGVYSQGTRPLPGYIQSILDEDVNPTPQFTVVREGPNVRVIEGDNALGHPHSAFAMEMAIEKARKTGIAAVGVRNAGHFGTAACYGMMAVREKMIGFATTSTAARNKIRTMHMYGIPIPPDWMLTADGKQTGDPDEGRMLATATGSKGYGLALIMGILAGPLVGGLMCCLREGGPSEHFFMALDISCFTDFDECATEVDEGLRNVKASKTVEGMDKVYLHGEIEWRNHEDWV